MLLAGLTGGIASGKSTVSARLVEHGAELVDADAIARHLLLPGTPTWQRVRQHFGDDILTADGAIDRPALGRIVFASPQRRTLLNELTHPPVMAEIADRLEALQAFDGVVVLDVPLLVEANADRSYEAVVVVATQPETQLRRLVDLRGMAPDDARARMAAQAPLGDKLAIATHVLWNDGTLDDLLAATDDVAADLLRRARDKHADTDADADNGDGSARPPILG
ncbi:MAG: dephospho-CoA kinase [Actinomycetota bacterium]|nr:dephospho-CoA kinase [Actinomycetota bacterium]MDQ3530581.1 dephospho-CoA kinase [Actinomycetota bacterium]